ncbi:MAG: class I SAM-dependent methyltransferase [Pseudonocardia sp.]|nr:class I SAM-dependent methyltransferase [Pseudonocardia sp.]
MSATSSGERPPHDEPVRRPRGPALPAERLLGWYVRLIRHYVGRGPYLDAGCATGGLMRRLVELGPTSGLAFPSTAAAVVRDEAPGCPVHTAASDLPDAGFRSLAALHVLDRMDATAGDKAVACWRRVLQPGGRALVVVADSTGRAHHLVGEDWNTAPFPRPHAEWREVLSGAGFVIWHEGSDGLWNGPYGRLPSWLDARAEAPLASQLSSGRLVLKPGAGESSVFVVENPA